MDPGRKRSNKRTRVLLLISILVASGGQPSARAEDNGGEESALLAALLSQLNVADDIAQRAADGNELSADRIRFDYARLHADLARICGGIEDYLTPQRAQPRDPVPIEGNYRSSSSAASH